MRSRRLDRQQGFTVIELMIAVAIVGVLASVAIPSFLNYRFKAKRTEAYANLSALAQSQKAYFSIYDGYRGVAPAEPGLTLGNTPGEQARDSTSVNLAFNTLGWAPEGRVFFDYDTNSGDIGAGCTCTKCFTSTAYGDVDGDNSLSAIMYVHPDANGNDCRSAMFGYTTPVDNNGAKLFDVPAQNRSIDDF